MSTPTAQIERINIADLEAKSREELLALAQEANINNYAALKKGELVFRLLPTRSDDQFAIISGGILEVVDDGYGFLRHEGLRG